MTTADDLKRAIETAWVHLRPGGAALLCPDFVKETFRPQTKHGGHDRMLRSLRYLEWTHAPDPRDTTIVTDFVVAAHAVVYIPEPEATSPQTTGE